MQNPLELKSQKSSDRRFPVAAAIFCYCAIMVLCSCPAARAVDLPRTARLLPPETLLLIDIDSFDQLAGQFRQTSFYRLYKDPAMASLLDDLKAKIKDEIEKEDDEVLTTFLNTRAFPHGRTALAIMPARPEDVNAPRVLIIAEWGDELPRVKEAMNKLLASAAEQGVNTRTEDYRGTTLTVLRDGGDSPGGWCFIDDCLLFSPNLDLLKSVVARLDSGSGSALADDSDYNAALKVAGPHHDLDIYVNMKQLIKTMPAEDEIGLNRAIVNSLGLDNVVSLGFSLGLARDPGNASSGRAFLRVDGEKTGVCKMLELESGPLRVPKFAPAGFYSATFVNINFKKAYDALYRIAAGFSPQFAVLMNMPILPAAPDGRPGLTIKADIIEHLGSQFLSFRAIDKSSSTPDDPKVRTVAALAANNRPELEASLSRLHAEFSQGSPDATRPLLGHTIYIFDLSVLLPALMPALPDPSSQGPGLPPEMPVAPALPKLAFTVTDTHVIMGVKEAVERAIRRLAAAAEPDALPRWYRRAKSAVPDAVGLAGLQDDAALARVFWKTLRETPAEPFEDEARSIKVGLSPTTGLSISQAGLDLINPGLSATYAIARQDGFFLEFKYLPAIPADQDPD